jgi:hypothetical protein
LKRIAPLDPKTYQRHLIHGQNRAWAETNCYTDVVIELLHGLGHEPIAALPFTLTIDFEGDQWTFFKFPQVDLFELYGFDIQELAVWRPLGEHIAEQVGAGRPVLVELDSYFLPDTAGTAYKLAHVKSTVAVNEIDIGARHMGYFHNQSYYALDGVDFADALQIDGPVHERMLPPYIEYIKPRAGFTAPTGSALVDVSLGILKKHLARIPRENPFTRFKERFSADLGWLLDADIDQFHAYSFATLRQYGACYELSETYLRWLAEQGVDKLDTATNAYQQISQTAKAFQFQLARSMARKKPLDVAPLDAMGAQWDLAVTHLQDRFG